MRNIISIILVIASIQTFAQWNKKQDKESIKYQFLKAQFDSPDLAAEYEYEITKNPITGKVPYNQRLKAFEQTQVLLKQNKSAIENVSWIERGPKNISGRTRAIMFDPDYENNHKVWAAGISGGLWYNLDIENNGEWHNAGSFWDNIAVSCINFDPNNTSTFYAGTGEGWTFSSVRGAGIWKSTDGGNTWNRLNSTDNADFHYVQKIVFSASGRIIASTNSGLFISDDSGSTWTEKIDGFFGDIEIAPNGKIYASKGLRNSAGTVFRSTDNGDNWLDLEITDLATERTELAIAPSNSNIIYAVSSVGTNVSWFKKSVDGGDNWTDIGIPMYLNQDCSESTSDFTRGQAWYDLTLMVNPTDEDMLYVGGIDWHKSTDGGDSWDPVTYWTGACEDYLHADQHTMVFFPEDNTKSLVGCDGGIFLVDNMIADFSVISHLNNNYNVTQFYGCAMENISGSNYMLAGAQDNGTQKFTEMGFGQTSEATGGDGGFCFIDQDNSQIQITSYVYNNWRVSDNGGNSFAFFPNTTNGSFINPGDYDNEENVLYASSSIDTIFVSDLFVDGANGNYKPVINGLNNSTISTIKVSSYNTDVIFVGTNNGDVFRITDATNNPTSSNLDPSESLPNGRVSSIDIGDTENRILLTYSNYGVESVWQTIDGGANWTNIEYNLPDMPIRWGLYNPENNNQILLATETGVWSINDISTENVWEPSNSGLANVRCDQLKYRTSDKLVAVATYGRGLFTSDIFADPEPSANFMADKTVSCPTDTVFFTDYSTKNPNQWTWVFIPNTVTFLGGTNEHSQNPMVQFTNAGNYSVELIATNNDGSGSITKNDYIQINNDCHYPIHNGRIYTCEGVFYDNGYTENYSNGEDYTLTISPSDEDSYITVDFTSFNVEYESNCNYDYLKIYDGNSTSSPLLGTFCGNNSPGQVSASYNQGGSLTFKFHSDGGAVAEGWTADISCTSTNIEQKQFLSAKIFPNPAKDIITINLENNITESELKVYNLLGNTVLQKKINTSETISVKDLKKGLYIFSITSKTNTFQKNIIIE